MPKVGKMHFPYTKAGRAAAKEARQENIKSGKSKLLTRAAKAKVKETPPVGLPDEVNPTTAPPPETRRRPAPEKRERIEPTSRPEFLDREYELMKFERGKYKLPQRGPHLEFMKKSEGKEGRRKRLQKAATTELMGGPKTREGARWMEERE